MTNFQRAIVRRVGHLVLVVVGMSVLMFFISHALPGDPARIAAGGWTATPEMIEAARERLGLDRPIYVQYAMYMLDLLSGDFGRSVVSNRPVVEDLIDFFPASLELTTFALLFATIVAIPIGVTAARKPNSGLDNSLRVVSTFFTSMPDFWLGLLLVLLFFGILGWFPFTGRLGFSTIPPPQVTGFMTIDTLLAADPKAFVDALWHLVLPGITLSLISIGFFSRMTRAVMVDVLRSQYIRTAQGKGASPGRVLYKHALKNAAIPIIVIMGIQFGNIVGGAVVVEIIFSWPGIGKYAVEAVQDQDFPAIMGFAITYSFFYATVNFVVDLLSLTIDPRLRRSFAG